MEVSDIHIKINISRIFIAFLEWSVIIFILCLGVSVLVFILLRRHEKNKLYRRNDTIGKWDRREREVKKQTMFYNNTKIISDKIMKKYPTFSADKFLNNVRKEFIKMQNSWILADWHKVRPFETNDVFEENLVKITDYVEDNNVNVVEKMSVEFAEFLEYYVENKKDILIVGVRAEVKDILLDAKTEILHGDEKTSEWDLMYKLYYVKDENNPIKAYEYDNKIEKENLSLSCERCGAPLLNSLQDRCEYCGSKLTIDMKDWILVKIEGIRKN